MRGDEVTVLRHGVVAVVWCVVAAVGMSGCAVPVTPDPGAPMTATAAFDASSKRRAPREGRKRDRAGISAAFNLAMEADENGPPGAAQIFRAVAQREAVVRETVDRATQAKVAGVTSVSWQALGPSNIGGRLRAVAIDPRNTSRVFVGAASGGIWLSEDAGNSWQPINDFLANLSVSTLVFDPGNPQIMYAGTGEGSAGLVGVGIFKSVDNGRTWTHLAATSPDQDADWRFVNRLVVHPQQTQVLLAGTTNGTNNRNGALFRSTNAGLSWTRVGNFKTVDLAFDPFNADFMVAGRDDGFIGFSRNAGVTWQTGPQLITQFTGRSSSARAEVAFSRTRPGVAYASIDHAKGEVWKSEDGGANWIMLSRPEHLAEQGDYDNALWVDPTNDNQLVIGGLDLHRSIDGGVNFTRISDWRQSPSSPHADQHAIVSVPNFGPANPMVYVGNDGGLYRTANINFANASGSTSVNGWTSLNRGLAVTQFYSGAGKLSAGGRIIGGTQDNGSLQLLSGNTWAAWRGGDGGHTAVDPGNDSRFYGSYVYLALLRATGGGTNSEYICEGITEGFPAEGGTTYCGAGATKKANFIAPFLLDPNNANRMLAGANSLWVTDDLPAPKPTWSVIKLPEGGEAGTNYISAIGVAPGNSSSIWVGHNGGQVFKTTNGQFATPTWIAMTGLPARQVQRFLISATNPDHVIVAFTGFMPDNVWETRNGGATWTSITANLPYAPVFTVVRHAAHADWLYAGTSVGVFASDNGGASWSATNDGPATVRVRDLFWYSNNELVAVTYGRGMFKATIAGAGPADYQGAWWAGNAENGWGLAFSQHGNTLVAGWYYYNASGQPTWSIMPGCTWNAAFTSCTGNVFNSTGAWLGNYSAAQFVQSQVGTVTFTFASPTAATMQWSMGGIFGQKTLSKLAFSSGTSPSGIDYSDVWWGGAAQSGWGVALTQQGGVLAGSWYTYNAQGQPVWYLINGGTWTTATTFTAPLTRATGSPLIGATYNPALFSPGVAGSITLTFTTAATATMSYTVDGVTQTKSLSRMSF